MRKNNSFKEPGQFSEPAAKTETDVSHKKSENHPTLVFTICNFISP